MQFSHLPCGCFFPVCVSSWAEFSTKLIFPASVYSGNARWDLLRCFSAQNSCCSCRFVWTVTIYLFCQFIHSSECRKVCFVKLRKCKATDVMCCTIIRILETDLYTVQAVLEKQNFTYNRVKGNSSKYWWLNMVLFCRYWIWMAKCSLKPLIWKMFKNCLCIYIFSVLFSIAEMV